MESLPILVLNETRKTLLASRLRMSRSTARGESFAIGTILPGDGYWVEPAKQVDTFGMAVPLDLLFLDADYRVVEKVGNLQPGALSPQVAKATGVLELPAGTIPATHTEIGDRILIEAIVTGGLGS